jgi:hypothetical protein
MSMSPSQEEGWRVLLDLSETFPTDWCLVGGQMVWLLSIEYDVAPLRTTDDVDVVVDVRANRSGISAIGTWLESHKFDLQVSTDGVGHRYIRDGEAGVGNVIFDVLAPENVGRRILLATTRGAHTLEAPGTREALNSAEPVQVSMTNRTGHVNRPSLMAAIFAKAAATKIPGRVNLDRDWEDAAFLLSLIPDPDDAAQAISKPQRRRLNNLRPLLENDRAAWRRLDEERARLGQVALEFLLNTKVSKGADQL